MNTVTFKNGELSIIKNFLNGIKVRGKASRGRSKLLKLLAKKEQELNDDLNDVRKPYLILGDNGEPLIEDNNVKFKDEEAREKVTAEIIELFDEKAVIDITEYHDKLHALYDALNEYEYDLSGDDANAYDLLLDELEKIRRTNNMLKKEKTLNLTGRSLVNGTDVVRFDARLSSTGGTTTINTYVNDQELYEKNRREVRKDMNDFRQYVFDQEDELFDDVKTDESDTTATE